jgi:predicted peroxiredoxin
LSTSNQPSLFINLASASLAHQGKALRMGRKMMSAGWPVTISLNTGAVSLVDPAHADDLDPVSGKPLPQILASFVAEGGSVLVGAECLQAAGLSMDGLPEGMALADIPTVSAMLGDPAVRTLSW